MFCRKCDKAMHRNDGNATTIVGIKVEITLTGKDNTSENIEYNNLQLGKYSDGNGECEVAICYECYIDGLFHMFGNK